MVKVPQRCRRRLHHFLWWRRRRSVENGGGGKWWRWQNGGGDKIVEVTKKRRKRWRGKVGEHEKRWRWRKWWCDKVLKTVELTRWWKWRRSVEDGGKCKAFIQSMEENSFFYKLWANSNGGRGWSLWSSQIYVCYTWRLKVNFLH